MAGLQLDPWQCWVLEQALGQRADGRWSAFEVGLVVPRQNGKGAVIEALELAALFLHGVPVIHTAHEMKTSRAAYKRIWELIAQTPALRRRVRKTRTSNEELSIEVTSGAVLKFMVRSGRSGRGLSDGDLIVLDEAMYLDPEQLAALIPTMSTRPNPQLWYTASAGLAVSEYLRAVRTRAEKRDPGLCWMEWSVEPPEPGHVLDVTDMALVAQANPALGIRISPEYVRSEVRILGEKAPRERFGVFDEPGTEGRLIGSRTWNDLADAAAVPRGSVAFGIDSNPERTAAAIGVAGRTADGHELVFVAEQGEGLAWVVERAVALELAHEGLSWSIDPNGPARSLIADLEAEGIAVERVTGAELGGACGAFYDSVVEGRLCHLGDPVLDKAVEVARKRDVGDGPWAWGRKNSEANIAPLVAVTLARHGLVTAVDLADNAW